MPPARTPPAQPGQKTPIRMWWAAVWRRLWWRMHRDVEPGPLPDRPRGRAGRSVVAVVGIDRYAEWPRLANAVNDARATARLFTGLGFEQVTAPLLDEAATGEAIRHLVTDGLAQLLSDDSLVIFFAGHGHTHTAHFGDTSVKTGCVIPVDGAPPRGHITASWLRLDSWLSDVARLPPRHILVLIDACHSGVALGALHKWRDEGAEPATELAALQARRSRRVITSALDDQRAMDGGPYSGHSLFTGCLIEALSGGLAEGGRRIATGRELGQYLQKRVRSYPPSTQTPDFGTFELDDRGDIVVPTLPEPPTGAPEPEQRAVEASAVPMLAADTRRAAASARRRGGIGPRITIVLGVGALVAAAAVIGTWRGEPNPPGTALDATNGAASSGPRAVVAAPSDSVASAAAQTPDAAVLVAPLRALGSNRSDRALGAGSAVSRDDALPSHSIPLLRGTDPPVPASRSRDRGRAPAAGKQRPVPAMPPASTAAPESPTSACSKADFAAVYEAASPAPEVVRAALRNLKACRDVGAITDADSDRYQTALVAKL